MTTDVMTNAVANNTTIRNGSAITYCDMQGNKGVVVPAHNKPPVPESVESRLTNRHDDYNYYTN